MIIKTRGGKYPRYEVISGLEILGGLCLLGVVWQVIWFITSVIKHLI